MNPTPPPAQRRQRRDALVLDLFAPRRRGDLNGGEVAMLTDRLEIKAGRPEIYGTQLSLRNGRWILDPILDSQHVDERRGSVGLPPLADYLRLVDSVLQRR